MGFRFDIFSVDKKFSSSPVIRLCPNGSHMLGVGTKRRPKTQKRRPLQNRLEITLKWFERDYRPTQKRETTRFAFINKFDQGLRFIHNPTKCTK